MISSIKIEEKVRYQSDGVHERCSASAISIIDVDSERTVDFQIKQIFDQRVITTNDRSN
jgi:hypothetical protein